MKLIFKGVTIELDYDEFQKMFPPKQRGSGNYPHRSVVTDKQKALIKHIFKEYPHRSLRSVAKELKLSVDQVRYWRDNGKAKGKANFN